MNDPLTVRLARREESAALALIGQATFLATYAHMIPQADLLLHCQRHHAAEVYQNWLANPTASIWVASVPSTENIVGYAVVVTPDFPDLETKETDRELRRIYLADRWAGAGVGHRLLTAAAAEAAQDGARRLLLAVYHGNEQALAFYRREGFSPVGTRSFLVGTQRYHDLVLARPLAA